jgi:predicted Zn-dependent protease
LKFRNRLGIDKAINALNKGDMRTAANFIKLIKPNKFNPDYQAMMAIYNHSIGNDNKAMEHADKAIQLRRYCSRYYNLRAKIKLRQGHYYGAVGDFKHCMYLDKEDKVSIMSIASIYLGLGQYDSCICYANKMNKHDSTSADPYYFLAKSYALMGDLAKAEENYNRLLKYTKGDSSYLKIQTEINELLNELRN